ncbi:MAG: 6-bladed beta-propeller [Candidatus Aminicenantaceae bacterium]
MKPLTWGSAILAAAALMCALPGCAPSETGWQGKIESRDGVTVVHNPRAPLHPEPVLELEEVLSIQGSETEEEQMFQDIRTLDVDSEGNIYILDEGAADIKVFNGAGKHVRTIGRQGQGPGEFAFPIMVLVTPQAELLVHDMNQRALKILDFEGNFLRQISIADMFQFTGPRFMPGGRMVGSHLVPAQEPLAELKLFDGELEPLLTIVSLPVEPPPVLHYFAGNSMTGLRWNLNNRGVVVWGDFLESEYALHVHDAQGNLLRTIEREYDVIRITEADKEPLLRKMFGDNPPPPQWDIRIPDRYPPFSGLSCDDSGRIYVKTYTLDGQEVGEAYDIFDAEGRYMAQVTLPVPLMVMRNDFLYTIVDNVNGFREVKRFRMNWLQEF